MKNTKLSLAITLLTIEVMHLSTMSVAILYIAGAHPRPLARVCGRHSPWPMSVTCRARVSCTLPSRPDEKMSVYVES